MAHPAIAAGSLLLISALTTPAAAPAQQRSERPVPMPRLLARTHQELPVWAEASVAISADGQLNPAVWGSETGRIREILTTPADNPIYFNGQLLRYQDEPSAPGCRDVGITTFDYPEPPRRGTLEDAVTDSAVALLGRVTAKAYGFSAGDPGQLFQIEPVRSYGLALSEARYYFFVPIGKFTVAGVTICKTDPRYAEPHEIGDEVFLFVERPEAPGGVFFQLFSPGDLVPVNADGSLRLPLQYTAAGRGSDPVSALQTKADLLTAIQGKRPSSPPR